MANKTQAKQNKQKENTSQVKTSSWEAVLQRFNSIMGQYAGLPIGNLYGAFSRAIDGYWANAPQINNTRVKSINPLPADVSKEELGLFLQNPQSNELGLQSVSEGLKWTNYSWFKTLKSYSDMLAFHSYAIPQYITADELASDSFKREYKLVDKLIKASQLKATGHKIAGQALSQGKVFYVPRYTVDKSHNTVNTFFMQELPKAWTTIIGLNNISTYTVSFNLMYFMQAGTDYRQFGDLFEPYMKDFSDWLEADARKAFKGKGKYVYASRNNADSFEYDIKAWAQNGRWFYYVSLPIDRVWTFEIDDSTAIVASPFSGLMQTYAQQSDYEAAQLSLIMNPLIKIFTGEVPYYKANEAKEDNGYRMTHEAMEYFMYVWQMLMQANNTGGTAMYLAPVENIKSHDYAESANANQISQSFLNYGVSKSGLSSLVAVTPDPHQGFQEYSAKLESKFAQCVYHSFKKMLDYIIGTLNLQYDFKIHIFGDIYTDDTVRANCLKQIDKGDLSAYFILAALDDESILDKVTMCRVVKSSGLTELLEPPQTSYTQSNKSQPKSDTGGAPTKDQTQVEETKIEKQVEVTEE